MIESVQDIENVFLEVALKGVGSRLEELGIDAMAVIAVMRPVFEDVFLEKLRLQKEAKEKAEESMRLKDEIRRLKEEITLLKRGKPAKPVATSENSSLPPSKDSIGFKRTQSLREKSGRKSGGQPGHKGHTREQAAVPTSIERCAPKLCPNCGKTLDGERLKVLDKRQVWDIPRPVAPTVTEYQRMGCVCECGCKCYGEYPKVASAPVSYGPNIHGAVAYLSTLQDLPFKRLTDAVNHLFGMELSQGTVSNMLQRMRTASKGVISDINDEISKAEVVGADETAVKVNGSNMWIWTFQTEAASYIFADRGRGAAAVEKHFPKGLPRATLVTDRHRPYFTMDVEDHQICLAHLIRNTIYMTQMVPESDWPVRLLALMRDAIHTRNESNGHVSEAGALKLRADLDELFDEKPTVSDASRQKELEKFKKGLEGKKDYIFTFLSRPDVPPDNNASERSVRPMKTKMKVSGQFKTETGAETYATLHSIVQTARKKGQSPINRLIEVAETMFA